MAVSAILAGTRPRWRPALTAATTDEELVARLRDGSDDAFEAIYDRYYRHLLAFCRHMLGSREEAEDALQHTFVAAYRALSAGREAVCLRPWLYTIARNRCLSLLRARREQVGIEGVEADGRSLDGLATQVQRKAELRELVEDLQRLPADQRAALVLFELGGHPQDEIAQVLDVRREKVKALVFQAREGLMRARAARETPCTHVREQLAMLNGDAPRRSTTHAHVERCPGCAEFSAQVSRQRAALALILPVAPTLGLKSAVLASALGGGVAAAGGAGGGAVAMVSASAGGGAGAGAVAGGGLGGGAALSLAGGTGAGGLGLGGGAAATGLAAAGSGAGVAGGLAMTGAGAGTIAGGLAALGAKGVVAKVLAAVAIMVPSAAPAHVDRQAGQQAWSRHTAALTAHPASRGTAGVPADASTAPADAIAAPSSTAGAADLLPSAIPVSPAAAAVTTAPAVTQTTVVASPAVDSSPAAAPAPDPAPAVSAPAAGGTAAPAPSAPAPVASAPAAPAPTPAPAPAVPDPVPAPDPAPAATTPDPPAPTPAPAVVDAPAAPADPAPADPPAADAAVAAPSVAPEAAPVSDPAAADASAATTV